ncbi:MAG: Omp28-related outer membrane protein [Ignavibacteria bacterium]
MKTRLSALIILAFSLMIISTQTFTSPRRVLIEFNANTACGYCPCADSIIQNHILSQFPHTVVINYHLGGSDPYIYFNGYYIYMLLEFYAYPLALFDRQSGPPMDYDLNWPDSVAARYERSPNSLINLNFVSKDYNPSTRILTATIEATSLELLSGSYYINFAMIENNLVGVQNFYAACGTPGYINNYVHNWVARDMINTPRGENLVVGTWPQNQTISKTVTTTVDTGWVASNCNLIAFVYKDTPPLNQSEIQQSTLQSVTNPLGVNGNIKIPSEYRLEQNYPNPFNPVTHIIYSIPKGGNVSLKIYDVLGNEVSVFIDGFMKAGTYNAEFNAANFASGVYFYTLKTDEFTATKKMLLIK